MPGEIRNRIVEKVQYERMQSIRDASESDIEVESRNGSKETYKKSIVPRACWIFDVSVGSDQTRYYAQCKFAESTRTSSFDKNFVPSKWFFRFGKK